MAKNIKDSICQEHIFSNIYNTYAQNLHDFLYYKYGVQFHPNDKTQEAFLKLWERCKSVPFEKAKSFLFTVANNMALNEIKHHKVVLNFQKIIPKNVTHETPEFILEKKEYLYRYQKALANLNADQRVAFLLNKVEGKKHQEIAELLGVTKKVIEYRIYSAFTTLKDQLEDFSLK